MSWVLAAMKNKTAKKEDTFAVQFKRGENSIGFYVAVVLIELKKKRTRGTQRKRKTNQKV
jgi:hypothetical protein